MRHVAAKCLGMFRACGVGACGMWQQGAPTCPCPTLRLRPTQHSSMAQPLPRGTAQHGMAPLTAAITEGGRRTHMRAVRRGKAGRQKVSGAGEKKAKGRKGGEGRR